jgi:hypothetical protein
MSAKSAADRVLGVVRGLRKGLSNLVARVMALRTAVRADKFRVAQRLRLALPLYVRHLETPLRKDIARLFDVSGLWVRNVGDRRRTKRNTLQIIRRIISRLKIPRSALAPATILASLATSPG